MPAFTDITEFVKAITDTKRLDWLESKRNAKILYEPTRQIMSVGFGNRCFTSHTLREAIDAAMASEAGGQPADLSGHV